MKHTEQQLIKAYPYDAKRRDPQAMWKRIKREDDLQLSLLSWIAIFIGFILVMVAILGAGWLDLNPIPVTLTFGAVCSVILWRKGLWRGCKAVWGYLVKYW